MKLSFGVVVSSAVALAFGIAFLYWAGNPPASEPVSRRSRQPVPRSEPSAVVARSDKQADMQQQALAALRQDMARLRREFSTLQRQIQEQGQAATAGGPGSEADPASDPRSDPAARAEAERVRQEQMAVIEATFRQEPIDREWSFKATGAVQEVLASADTVRPALRSLECRSQTCRMELAEDDTGELEKSMPRFLLQLGETLPRGTVNYIEDGAGGKTMILYMDRGASESPGNGK
jgi:hypothetical protein